MKKGWKKPELAILDANMTMNSPKIGEHLDLDYPDGTPREDLTWS